MVNPFLFVVFASFFFCLKQCTEYLGELELLAWWCSFEKQQGSWDRERKRLLLGKSSSCLFFG